MSVAWEIELRMHSGIPVVGMAGEWTTAAREGLSGMIEALAACGHFNIVVDLRRLTVEVAPVAASLIDLSAQIRRHFGHLELVGTPEQLSGLTQAAGGAELRASSCEEAAIARFMRAPHFAPGMSFTAHPVRWAGA